MMKAKVRTNVQDITPIEAYNQNLCSRNDVVVWYYRSYEFAVVESIRSATDFAQSNYNAPPSRNQSGDYMALSLQGHDAYKYVRKYDHCLQYEMIDPARWRNEAKALIDEVPDNEMLDLISHLRSIVQHEQWLTFREQREEL